MKYAVLYQSKNGNTGYLAEQIYKALDTDEKTISDIDELLSVPEADVYLVGFGVRNNFCSLEILDILEQITEGRIAIFATCGCLPTEAYKESLERHLEVWIPENTDYMGMFLCQGQTEQEGREKLLNLMPDRAKELQQMFYLGETHPDQDDIAAAIEFTVTVQERIEA